MNDKPFQMRLTAGDRKRYVACAKSEGMKLAAWFRASADARISAFQPGSNPPKYNVSYLEGSDAPLSKYPPAKVIMTEPMKPTKSQTNDKRPFTTRLKGEWRP